MWLCYLSEDPFVALRVIQVLSANWLSMLNIFNVPCFPLPTIISLKILITVKVAPYECIIRTGLL